MMKAISICLCLLVGVTPFLNAQISPKYDELIKKLAADFETPGVAVAVMNDFKFEEFVYGVSNIESKKQLTSKTLFNVASISKLVTSHAVMILVEQGKIDLDKPIENYLVSWKFSKSSPESSLVTTRLVLNHMAGLSGEFGPGFYESGNLKSLVDILSGMSEKRRSLRIISKPGTKQAYSNLGFGLLQLLVEDVTKQPFKDFVKENVLNKLNMTASGFDDPLSLDSGADLATPYDYRLAALQQERFVVVAAAGFLSNLKDLELLLLEETRDKKLLSKSSFEQMHLASGPKNYGLGHIVQKIQNRTAFVGHTGLGMGWNASFQFIPDSDDGIIVLTNGDNGMYIHNTLTCYWYYSQSGKRTAPCKTAPDKKLNGIGFYLEISHEKGLIKKSEFDEFELALKESRKSLSSGNFEQFTTQLKNLRSKLRSAIKDAEIQAKLDKVFESSFYWMKMPWFSTK